MISRSASVCSVLGLAAAPVVLAAPVDVSSVAAAEGVVERVTPSAKGAVSFKLDPALQNKITISGVPGSIRVEASDVRRLIAGYGWYLKNIAKVHLSWNGNRLALPSPLPAPASPVTIESPWKTVFAYNYCTLSYTAAFWDWKRWQQEIDFLALNGFTHALVTAGLEKTWEDFLIGLGYPRDKVIRFVPNPAFAAWWNMGNLEGHGGPLTQRQIDKMAQLGKRIVSRMEQLGMTPVLQGYVGFVPADFAENVRMKGLELIPQGEWVNFKRPWVVDPTCEAFPKLAADWYRSLRKVYGISGKMFGGDLFHEGGSKGNINVTQAAKAVQKAMQEASPGSTWVIQAWGGNPSNELLVGMDPKHALVLQLTKNMASGGKNLRTFDGIPWVWCELSNFGGNTGMYGGIPLLSRLGSDLSAYRDKGLTGMGVLSEGLETNPLHYALFCDRLWTLEDIPVKEWLRQYTLQRYGMAPEPVVRALKVLSSSIYSPVRSQEGCTESIVCARPAWNVRKASTWSSGERYYRLGDIVSAARDYLKVANEQPSLVKEETFRYDLVDLVRQVLADAAFYQLQRVRAAFDAGNVPGYKKQVQIFLSLITDMDAVLATDRQFLLGTWQEKALNWGETRPEKALMDRSAKMLLTTWIDQAPRALNDYSNRQWAGLVADFYLPRWKNFFESQLEVLTGKKDRAAADASFMDKTVREELAFAGNGKVYSVVPSGDALSVANRVMKARQKVLDSLCLDEKHSSGLAWDLKQGSPLRFDVTDRVDAPGTYTATFQWKEGPSALKINSVKLYEGDREVAADVHEGWTGVENNGNSYMLVLKKYRTNLDSYTLKAEVSGASGADSQGEMILKKNGN
ncbi:MAG: alpha-N-acetylglucosaminidase [Akkermansiaceae bacterium]|nr:alpha-N-acetylglucosaminidase [Akkermansiaceae bacterium]